MARAASKFAALFEIPVEVQRVITGFWLLDKQQFAVCVCVCVRVCVYV